MLTASRNNSTSSHVTLRSNVHLRNEAPMCADRDFIRRVRGRNAISKLLSMLGIDTADRAATRRILTPRQIAEFAWERRCERCGCLPEGPVLNGGREEIKFRCPLGTCESRQLVGTQLLLEARLVDAVCHKTGLPALRAVTHVLSSLDITDIAHYAPMDTPKRRFTVALTPWQRYMLSDAEIEVALKQFLQESVSCEK